MNLIKKIKRARPKISNDQLLQKIINHPTNSWFLKDKFLTRSINRFFESWDQDIFNFFIFNKKNLSLACSTGRYSCTFPNISDIECIILFPDLIKLLKSSSPDHGIAILAHELGHIVSSHAIKKISPLEAQVEADKIACRLGHGKFLQDILMDFHNIEAKVRISYLTSELIRTQRLL